MAHYTAYPVVRDGNVLGVLPLRRALETPRREWEQRWVSDCMLTRDEVPVLEEDEDALQALTELGAGDLHRGLVREDGRLAGLFSITDIARLLAMPRPRRPIARAR